MYTIKQAARRSGVNVALLRAWERRYGIVTPARTETGYRLYDEEAIERLRTMRALVEAGWSAKQAAERVGGAPAADLASIATSAGRPGGTSDPIADEDAVRAFVDGATRIDGGAIEAALDEMFSRGSFERIVEDRLYPALRALGEAWAAGQVDVAGEHASSAAAVRRLSMAFEAAGGSGGPSPLLVGLPPGARHEVAALAFATAARRAGMPVVYLGPDVPAESWVAAVERTAARAVAFGVVMEEDLPGAAAVVDALRAAQPAIIVAVGGAQSSRLTGAGALILPDRLDEAVEALRGALDGAGAAA